MPLSSNQRHSHFSVGLSGIKRITTVALAFSLFLLFSYSQVQAQSEGLVPDTTEYQALVDIYNNMGGASWTDNTNWLQGTTNADYDTWFGVKVVNGDVTELSISANEATGAIPVSIGNLTELKLLSFYNNNVTGSIPSEIGNLTKLEKLFLDINAISGSIPTTITNLTSLQRLHLQNNNLSGSIPAQIGSMTSLQYIKLDHNAITGSIPTSINTLDQALHLHLDGNNLTGPIPTEIGGMTNLTQLRLGNNGLSGAMPASIEGLTNLTEINFYNNDLTGAICTNIGDLVLMKKLILDVNDLTGTIPVSITEMGLLEQLHLQDNNLESGLPDSIGTLTNLKYLYAQNNNLTEPIPESIGTLSAVTRFYAHGNDITGSIPEAIGGMTSLEKLRLEGNAITGVMPDTVTSLTNLTLLLVNNNFITGIPDFNNHPNATSITINVQDNYIPQEDLDMNSNLFGGGTNNNQNTIGVFDDPQIQALYDLYIATGGDTWSSQTDTNTANDWPRNDDWAPITTVDQASSWYGVTVANGNVTRIVLNGNNLIGQLPASLGALTSMTIFAVQGNQLDGILPSEIANLSNLSIFGVAQNQFSGPIPEWLGSMVTLTQISMWDNLFTGSIPDTLSNLSNLEWLFIGGSGSAGRVSEITGNIPESLGELVSLKQLWIYMSEVDGTIPESFGNLTNLTSLCLYGNDMVGGIPDTLRNLTGLEYFHIGAKGLDGISEMTGPLPDWIGELTNLQYMWIYQAKFHGPIPSSWSSLTNLRIINMSSNDLTGTLPGFLGSFDELIRLSLADNNFTGSIPNSFSGLTALQEVYLFGNQLSGDIPDIFGQMPSLWYLDMRMNQLSGTLPASLGSLSSLQELYLSGNSLSGTIPATLGNLTQLWVTWLYDNQFTGLADLSNHPNKDNLVVQVQENHLPFADLETNFNGIDSHNFFYFSYAPQAQPPAEVLAAIAGVPQTFDANDGANTQYQWQVGVSGAWSDIPGATNATYTAELAADQMDLHLRCAKTNTLVTGITIYTPEYILERTAAVPDLAENMPIDSDLGPQPQNIGRPLTDTNAHTINYVRSFVAREADLIEAQLSINAPASQVQLSTKFLDGLGRPVQLVIKQESPTGKDIVHPITYDDLGRTEKEYLSFTQVANGNDAGAYHYNDLQKQYDFYHVDNSIDGIANTDFPYTHNGYEASLLKRMVSQAAPGENWAMGSGHELEYGYRSNNTATDGNIPIWSIGSGNLPTITGFFTEEELYVQTTKNEAKNEALEFIDKRSRVILRKIEDTDDNMGFAISYLYTYYIYDDFDNLRFVIPPQAVRELDNGAILDLSFKDQWLFTYNYDSRQRLIEKQVPGAKPILMWYDLRDRLVLTQDGNQRNQSPQEYTFTKYDALNRPVMSGIYTTSQTSAQLQTNINALSGIQYFESRGTDLTGYTNRSFPTGISEPDLLAVTYYDDYTFPHGNETGYQYQSELGNPTTSDQGTKGLITGSLIRILGTGTWLKSVSYYDDYGRDIQSFNDNHKGGVDRITNRYDFVGNVEETLLTHSDGTTTTPINRVYNYDDADRLLDVTHQVGTEAAVTLAANEYNEIGELIKKELGEDEQ